MAKRRKAKEPKVISAPLAPAAAPAPGSNSRPGQRPVNVWLPEALVEAMTAYRKSLRPAPSKTAVVQTALEDFLEAKGFWSGRKDPAN